MSGRAATINIIPGNYALAVGPAPMPSPRGWRWVCLADVAQLESGHTPSRLHPEYWDGGIPWIGIKDAREHHGEVISETLQTVTQAGLDNSAARLLPPATVCLSRTASVGYVTVMGQTMATSQDFVNWSCGPELEPHFLKQLLIAENESLFRFGKGSTHTTIYYPEVKAFYVCLPPIVEQRHIVAKLEALQSHSRRAREAIDAVPPLLEKLRRSILAAAFRGDLTADWRAQNPHVEPLEIHENSELADGGNKHLWGSGRTADGVDPDWGAIPASWRWVRVRDLNHDSSTAVQIGPMSMKSNDFVDAGTRVLNVGCVQRGRIDINKADHLPPKRARDFERYRLEPEDVLFTRSGTVGRCAILPAEFGGALMTFHLLRVRPSPDRCAAAFLMFAFQGCHAVSAQIEASSVGATRAGFNTRLLADMWIPMPPRAEQTELLSRITTLVGRLEALQAQLDATERKLTAADAAVLAKAFRGELVLQDLNDEPAEVTLSRAATSAEAPRQRARRAKAAE